MASLSNDRRRRLRPRSKRPLAIVLGIAGALLIFSAARRIVRPYRLEERIDVQIAVLNRQHERLLALSEERRRYRDHLRTPEGQEAIARRAGFHLQGERVYLIPTDPR